jgi:hypothetical protein
VIDLSLTPFVLFKDRYQLPNVAGVYFVVHESRILYVGKARSLLRRWKTHHRAMQMRGAYRIYWQEAPLDQVSTLEDEYIAAIRPPWNEGEKFKLDVSAGVRQQIRALMLQLDKDALDVVVTAIGRLYQEECIDAIKAKLGMD